MPCYDPRDNEKTITEYVHGVGSKPYEYKIDKLNEQIDKLEASLCALITELESEGIADIVITNASKKGLIDLVDFWYEHSINDQVRMSRELHKFSEHERAIMKKLLDVRINYNTSK